MVMVEVYLGVLIAIIAAFIGSVISIYTKEEIKKYFKMINGIKEILVFGIGLLLLIVNERSIHTALIIFTLGAVTATILNKVWLRKYSRLFELAILGLVIGGVFNINVQFGFIIVALVAIYNLIAESINVEPILSKKGEIDLKVIAATQLVLLFSFLLSFMLFSMTSVVPTAFATYASGALIFIVFEPGSDSKNLEAKVERQKKVAIKKKKRFYFYFISLILILLVLRLLYYFN